MSSSLDGCSHVVDTNGLLEIALANENEKGIFIAALEAGEIGVPAVVWQEFCELYEEDAEGLEPFLTKKIIMKKAYHIGAAAVADKLNSSLSFSPYDSHADLCTAAICQIEDRTLLTSVDQAPHYAKLQSCKIQTLAEWLKQQ